MKKYAEKLGLVGLDSMNAIVEAMAERNSSSVIELSSDIIAGGVSIEQFAVDLAEYFRSLLFISCGIEKESLLGYARSRYSEKTVGVFSKTQLEKALEIIFKFYREVRYSINPRFELELVLSQLSDLRAWIAPADVADRLEALKQGIASGAETIPVQTDPATMSTEPPVYQSQPQVPTPAPEAPAAPSGLSVEEREAVLEAVRKKKLTLAAAVDQAIGWRQSEDHISFSFENGFQATVVKNDRVLLQDALREVTGKNFIIEVEVVQTRKESVAEDGVNLNKQVDAVKKVFRGEVIQGDI